MVHPIGRRLAAPTHRGWLGLLEIVCHRRPAECHRGERRDSSVQWLRSPGQGKRRCHWAEGIDGNCERSHRRTGLGGRALDTCRTVALAAFRDGLFPCSAGVLPCLSCSRACDSACSSARRSPRHSRPECQGCRRPRVAAGGVMSADEIHALTAHVNSTRYRLPSAHFSFRRHGERRDFPGTGGNPPGD